MTWPSHDAGGVEAGNAILKTPKARVILGRTLSESLKKSLTFDGPGFKDVSTNKKKQKHTGSAFD